MWHLAILPIVSVFSIPILMLTVFSGSADTGFIVGYWVVFGIGGLINYYYLYRKICPKDEVPPAELPVPYVVDW